MPSNTTRLYTRFIPSEEIVRAVPWGFEEMGVAGELPPPAQGAAGAEYDEAVRPVESEAQSERLRQACDEAYARGMERGAQQAAQEWQQRLDDYIRGQGREQAERLAGVVQAFEASLAGLQQGMASDLLTLACDIARQVVRQELQSQPRALLPVVREALATFVQDSRLATVRLNPADWAALEPALRSEFDGARVHWLADASVTPGGCSVECAGAVVDGTLETRWRRAIAALGLVSAWREQADGD
ncbi:MAG: flagellar assembly protein FliH [Comamonadaceae bacterium]|nr:flagellar assembly protein FliH [Burkholderiales bacterium]MEB2348491.1 flagellar assembly protein FliH [Comamonadaceae bacterium]